MHNLLLMINVINVISLNFMKLMVQYNILYLILTKKAQEKLIH
jgi:hypothetical protein